MPASRSVFSFGDRFGADLYVDVTNLTNKANIRRFNNDPLSPALEAFERLGNPGSRLALRDGALVYGPAREVYFGARIRF